MTYARSTYCGVCHMYSVSCSVAVKNDFKNNSQHMVCRIDFPIITKSSVNMKFVGFAY